VTIPLTAASITVGGAAALIGPLLLYRL
jgi:hypothetical protein